MIPTDELSYFSEGLGSTTNQSYRGMGNQSIRIYILTFGFPLMDGSDAHIKLVIYISYRIPISTSHCGWFFLKKMP